jgi:hypothetical protein
MLRDADHHSPKSCNQFYFLWCTSQELCSFILYSLFSLLMRSKPNRRLCFFFFFAFLSAKPNRRLCIFYWFTFSWRISEAITQTTFGSRKSGVGHIFGDVRQAGRLRIGVWRVSLQVGQLGVLGRVAVLRSDCRQVQGRAHNCVNFLRKIIAFDFK